MENPLLTVAFVIAATQFFKARFPSISGGLALLCSFLVSLFVALAPVAAAQFPAVGPWLTPIVSVIALFIGSAGSYDLIANFVPKVPPISSIMKK